MSRASQSASARPDVGGLDAARSLATSGFHKYGPPSVTEPARAYPCWAEY